MTLLLSTSLAAPPPDGWDRWFVTTGTVAPVDLPADRKLPALALRLERVSAKKPAPRRLLRKQHLV